MPLSLNPQFYPIAADCSSKKMWRRENPPAILMQEENKKALYHFKELTEYLIKNGVPVPRILDFNPHHQTILCQDLGDRFISTSSLDHYQKATDILRKALFCPKDNMLPLYDRAYFFMQSLCFIENIPHRVLGKSLSEQCKVLFKKALDQILDSIDWQEMSLTFRDYHAGNIMLYENQLYVIDYQDAGFSPIGYDLMSLLQDARHDVSQNNQQKCVEAYKTSLSTKQKKALIQNYDALAVLRHMRVIAIFIKLADEGKSKYLAHIPRLIQYLEKLLPAFPLMQDWLITNLPLQRIKDHAFSKN